jgi:hypothetical protein
MGAVTGLVDLSYAPTVTIHILPSSTGANPGLGGAINLAATDDAPELLLSDGLVEDQLSQDVAVAGKARATFNNVRADALNLVDSRKASYSGNGGQTALRPEPFPARS